VSVYGSWLEECLRRSGGAVAGSSRSDALVTPTRLRRRPDGRKRLILLEPARPSDEVMSAGAGVTVGAETSIDGRTVSSIRPDDVARRLSTRGVSGAVRSSGRVLSALSDMLVMGGVTIGTALAEAESLPGPRMYPRGQLA